MRIKTEKLSDNIIKNIRDDYGAAVLRFRQFAHFKQSEKVDNKTTKIPNHIETRLESSPTIKIGEKVFGVNLDGSIEWLGEIIMKEKTND